MVVCVSLLLLLLLLRDVRNPTPVIRAWSCSGGAVLVPAVGCGLCAVPTLVRIVERAFPVMGSRSI